jgi:predicted CopG family antitoxin
MSDNRKNIKIPEDLFHQLKEQKGPRRSWPQFLEDELVGDNSETTKANGGLQSGDVEDIAEQLQEHIEYPESQDTETIVNRIEDLESRLPRKVAEELR